MLSAFEARTDALDHPLGRRTFADGVIADHDERPTLRTTCFRAVDKPCRVRRDSSLLAEARWRTSPEVPPRPSPRADRALRISPQRPSPGLGAVLRTGAHLEPSMARPELVPLNLASIARGCVPSSKAHLVIPQGGPRVEALSESRRQTGPSLSSPRVAPGDGESLPQALRMQRVPRRGRARRGKLVVFLWVVEMLRAEFFRRPAPSRQIDLTWEIPPESGPRGPAGLPYVPVQSKGMQYTCHVQPRVPGAERAPPSSHPPTLNGLGSHRFKIFRWSTDQVAARRGTIDGPGEDAGCAPHELNTARTSLRTTSRG